MYYIETIFILNFKGFCFIQSQTQNATLSYYWPLNNSSELISKANLINGANYSFTKNRLNKPNTAIIFSSGGFEAPAGIYFKSPFSLTFWVNYQKLATNARVLDFGNGEMNDNVAIALQSTGGIGITIKNGTRSSFDWATSNTSLNINKWYHVTFVHQNGKAAVYVNGKKEIEKNLNSPNQVQRTKNYIAKSNWKSDPVSFVTLSDLKIYNGALTDNEIMFDYSSTVQLPMMSCG